MFDNKLDIKLKGRRVALMGIKEFKNYGMWIIFDEPEKYKKDEQDKTCKTYFFDDKLHAMIVYNRIIKAYKRSRKDKYKVPIRIRNTNA